MTTLDASADLLSLFADPTRVRLVSLLNKRELSVVEITTITELAQSRVSTHLGRLREAGVVRDRRVGASTMYTVNDAAMPAGAGKVWSLLEHEVRDAVLEKDRARCEDLIRARDKAAAWPDALAGQMERHYSPGRTWEATARAFLGLLRLGDVLDVGSGDGTIAQLLAPRAKSIVCIDRSEKMIEAATSRLASLPNARAMVGDVHELPFRDKSFDQLLLFNVLVHAETPSRVMSECARVLRAGGSLAVVTLDAHEHGEVTAAYRHRHDGFAPATLRRMLRNAGLTVEQCEVTSRERRQPYFNVVTAFAHK